MAEKLSSEVVNLYQPKKRFLIPINNFHVPKKLFKLFKKNNYIFRVNNNFEKVISQCQIVNRKDNGTWINDIILNTYINLHKSGMCHSIECYEKNDVLSSTKYEYEFTSSLQKENIYGTQFHPEKSHKWGERILNNFINL